MAEREKQDFLRLGGESHIYNKEDTLQSTPWNSDIYLPRRNLPSKSLLQKKTPSKPKDVFWFKHVNLIKIKALKAEEKQKLF